MPRSSSFALTSQSVVAGLIALAASATGVLAYSNRQPLLRATAASFESTPLALAATAALDLKGDVRRAMRSGRSFRVILDACPFDDEPWQGDIDPLGVIKCGESYVVQFDRATNAWVATGPNEVALLDGASNPMVTSSASASAVSDNTFLIWGADFGFDEHRFVLAADGVTPLGHIVLGPSEAEAQ